METTIAEHYGKKIIAALYLVLLCVSLYFTLFENSDARKVSRVKADLRSFNGAIDSYYVDDAEYPTVHEAVSEEPVLLSNTYDPTNGIIVLGDPYRVKQ